MSELLRNKKAFFNYEIVERFEAGIELLGMEVKSLRAHLGNLEGSHVTVRGGEAYLINMTIPPFQPKNAKDYDEKRMRKLLLTKDEIIKLAALEKGLTIVPIAVYNKGRKIKIEIASVKGKKKFDKRETLKKRDAKREIDRTLKYE
jgi:SsrA-binding protein